MFENAKDTANTPKLCINDLPPEKLSSFYLQLEASQNKQMAREALEPLIQGQKKP